jgi:hypothetical protein
MSFDGCRLLEYWQCLSMKDKYSLVASVVFFPHFKNLISFQAVPTLPRVMKSAAKNRLDAFGIMDQLWQDSNRIRTMTSWWTAAEGMDPPIHQSINRVEQRQCRSSSCIFSHCLKTEQVGYIDRKTAYFLRVFSLEDTPQFPSKITI